MSEVAQGPGWWQASDGKWYAPELHPSYRPPTPPITYPAPTPPPGYWRAADGNWYPPRPGAHSGRAPAGHAVRKPVYLRVWLWVLVVVALGIGVSIAVVSLGGQAVNDAAAEHTVVYSVYSDTGAGQAPNVTYTTLETGSGQTGEAHLTGALLPWSKTIIASGAHITFHLSATVGPHGGSISCVISEDGRELDTNTATGVGATTTCTGSGP